MKSHPRARGAVFSKAVMSDAFSAQHHSHCFAQDSEVHAERPAANVFAIEFHAPRERRVLPCGYLPEAGQPRCDVETLPILQCVVIRVINGMRAGPDQAHLATQDIPKLRQFIKAVTPQKPPGPRDARVVGNLEEWAISLILSAQRLLALVGIGHHGAELVAEETTAFASKTWRTVERRSL